MTTKTAATVATAHIAAKYLGINVLETRNSDALDFHEVAVFEVPFGDLASSDGFAECGDFDVSHCRGGVLKNQDSGV
jgi:hypothetical protein